VSELDKAVEEYVERSKASCREVGYGTPDDMYVDWASDAFRKGAEFGSRELQAERQRRKEAENAISAIAGWTDKAISDGTIDANGMREQARRALKEQGE